MNENLDRTVRVIAWVGIGLLILVALLLVVGCGERDRVDVDIDDDDADLVVVPWTLYVNYDDHPNVAARCDGTTRLYTHTRDSHSLVAVPDHPLCQEGQR